MENAIDSGTQGFTRHMSVLNRVMAVAGRAAQVLGRSAQASRPNPAGKPEVLVAQEQQALTPEEQKHAAGLMPVNHVGEICAQALYRVQALFCCDAAIQKVLYKAAAEEFD